MSAWRNDQGREADTHYTKGISCRQAMQKFGNSNKPKKEREVKWGYESKLLTKANSKHCRGK